MTISVYGRRNSSSVQLVIWALNELGVAYERLDYGRGHASTQTREYLAMNPMGLVPVLKDDDVCLFESAAILRYLSAKFGNDVFWPQSVAARARIDSWADWGKHTFASAVLQIFVYDVLMAPETREVEFLERATEKVTHLATMLDARIAEGPWINGEDFTFADIACGHVLYRYFTMNWERPKLPSLGVYYDRLTKRPAFSDHVMVSYEALRGPD